MARARTTVVSPYMLSLHEGGVTCWWCSEKCEGPCVPMPTRPASPWGLVGFFCCVGCAKAYMLHRGLPVSYLKLYVRTYAGIPFSCPLPCSPPWQTMEKYGPPAGVLSLAQFRHAAWAPLPGMMDLNHATSMPIRMGRHDLDAQRAQLNSDRPTRPNARVKVSSRDKARKVDAIEPKPVSARLARRGPKAMGGILSFFTHNQKGGS
jgi:hypothetical protein